MFRRPLLLSCAFLVALPLVAQSSAGRKQRDLGENAPPRSDSGSMESSSKDTKIDLSPPPGDAREHPNSGVADEVLELHPYDPHRAEKNIEVGDYYYKDKNLRAAESRYREALQYKPNDAIATYKLAVTLEKEENFEEAKTYYTAYLNILPDGPMVEKVKEALARLDNPQAALANPEPDKKKKKKQ